MYCRSAYSSSHENVFQTFLVFILQPQTTSISIVISAHKIMCSCLQRNKSIPFKSMYILCVPIHLAINSIGGCQYSAITRSKLDKLKESSKTHQSPGCRNSNSCNHPLTDRLLSTHLHQTYHTFCADPHLSKLHMHD
jgi:hypothetical protein